MPHYAGLDFGTTNSTLGLCAPKGPARLLPLETFGGAEHLTIPSALFFSFEDGATYLGRNAVFEYRDGAEGRFMRALKSILGSKLMEETTQIGRERWTFEALIGRFLKHLRDHLVRAAEEDDVAAERVVLGRPVRFVDEDDAADRAAEEQLAAAARSQGFTEIEFQFEPVAAALHYEASIAAEELALVVDIGGGTSDFTLIRLSPEAAKGGVRGIDRRSDILATTGVHVGGTDFDRLFSIASAMPSFGLGSQTADGKRRMPVWYFNDMATWHRINTLYNPKVRRDVASLIKEAAEPEKLERYAHLLDARSGHRLAASVEAAKIELSDTPQARIALREPPVSGDKGLDLDVPATRAQFEAATADLVARIGAAIEEALAAGNVRSEAVETVILTGGGAQVPAVLAAATSRFPSARIAPTDRFGSVGLGLAIDAARRFA